MSSDPQREYLSNHCMVIIYR